MIDLPFDESRVRDRLSRRDRRVMEADALGEAAVLVPLFWKAERLHLLFTKRTDTVSTHKGQISFPGGRREPADENLLQTALRESWEEIGLRPDDVRVLGALDDTVTLKNVRITPYVGLIPADYTFAVHPDEVAYLIEVPVAEFLDPDRLRAEDLPHPDGHTRTVYFYDVGEEVIWGATARIVKEWLDAMETLRRQGKIYYVGSSNFAGWDIATAQLTAARTGHPPLVTEQSVYNLANRAVELEVLPACRHFGVGVIPWSPLAGGLLGGALAKAAAGRRATAETAQKIAQKRPQLEAYEKLCAALDASPADVALAWLLANSAVTAPIIGPRTLDQLNGALKALQLRLNDETLKQLDTIFPGPGEAPVAYAW